MLDQVIVSQATLGALSFLASAVSSALLLIFGGLLIRALLRRWTKRGFVPALLRLFATCSVWLGALFLILTATMFGLAYVRGGEQTRAFDVDISPTSTSTGLKPFMVQPCGTWRVGAVEYSNCIYEGQVTLRARYGDGKVFEETGNAVWATGIGERLTSLHFFSAPMTFQEVVAKRAALVADWHLPADQFKLWSETKEVGSSGAVYFYAPEENRPVPWVEISVRKLENPADETHGWTSSVKWNWER